MISFLKHSNLLSSRVITGVEVVLGKNNQFNYCQIKNYYGKLSIKKRGDLISSIDILHQKIGKNKNIPFSSNPPIALTITGKQVILKQIEALEDEDDTILLQKVLPGAKMDSFYIQKYRNGNKWFLAILKKEILDQLLQEFKTKTFDVISIFLGPFCIIPFIENTKELILPQYTLQLNNDTLFITQTNSLVGSDLHISNEVIPFYQIIPFSSAFYIFSNSNFLYQIEPKNVLTNKEEVKFYIYLIALLRFFLVIVLFMALTNYFLNKAYQNALSDLQTTTSEQQRKYLLYEKQQQELNQQISILQTTGVSSVKTYTYYADKIAELLPQSISLLNLHIGVISNKMKTDTKLNIIKNKIIIRGIANNTLDLNEFLLKLEQEKWVKRSIIKNYNQTDRENPGIFEINITINE